MLRVSQSQNEVIESCQERNVTDSRIEITYAPKNNSIKNIFWTEKFSCNTKARHKDETTHELITLGAIIGTQTINGKQSLGSQSSLESSTTYINTTCKF